MHTYNISLFLLDSQQQFDGDILSSRIPLLVKYYDGNLQREAAALEAIEELAELRHPTSELPHFPHKSKVR